MLAPLGCASAPKGDDIRVYLNPKRATDPGEVERFGQVLKELRQRNETVEKSPEWLREAYGSVKIKLLNDIPREEFAGYGKYLKKNAAYIIVHPAYYAFFENDVILSSEKDKTVFPEKNIVERLYDRLSFFDLNFKIMQEQERLLRDFLEVMSAEKRLIIVVLPLDYEGHLSYGRIPGLDEYARYINEVTNESESVIYVKSSDWNLGYLTEENLGLLSDFLREIGARHILLGGGYIGRCLENFYMSITGSFGTNEVYVLPEIAAVSPRDLSDAWTGGLLTGEGRIDFKTAARNLKKPNAYGIQRIMPNVGRLSIYDFYPRTPKNKP
ncbi:MAG: hypothetical protein Q8J64_07455 [Thermodesulfovibrionales bacterium]|nr:hypothetical protein [Thermodesulfovibrionales bacterium]